MLNVTPMAHHQGGVMDEYREWLESSGRAVATIDKRVYDIRRLGREVKLFGATERDLVKYMAARRDYAPETRKGILSSIKLFYRWAYKTGLVDPNPALDLEPIPVPRRIPRVAPDWKIQEAIESCSLPDRALILLGRYACLRLSEIANLHTRDRDGDTLRVIGKGNKERIVFINDELMQVLLELESRQGEGYYFPGRFGGHREVTTLSKYIKDLTGCNPHSLRHAGASSAYRATKNLRAVQEFLGHASLNTTQKYLHLEVDELREVAAGTVIKKVA